MYKLMIVDDEPDIREGLQEVIPFEELGFTVVGEAENGIEALQTYKDVNPDVIITDIRMPLMDGLTMCREIRKEQQTIHFIFLSGYDEFEYARQAIELKSMRYLLKPISSIEFIEILKGVRADLDEEFNTIRDLDRLRQHFQKSLPILREILLSSLVSGNVSVQAALPTAERYSLSLTSDYYVLALIRVVGQEDNPSEQAIREPELLGAAVQTIVQDVVLCKHKAHFFHYNDMFAVLFLMPDREDATFSGILTSLENTQKNLQHYLHAKALIGVSEPCDDLSRLTVCAGQALSALEQSGIFTSEQVLCVTDLESKASDEPSPDPNDLRALYNAIKSGDLEGSLAAGDRLIGALAETRPTPQLYRLYIMEMCSSIVKNTRDLVSYAGTDMAEITKDIEALTHCPPEAQAKKIVGDISRCLIRKIGSERTSNSRRLIDQSLEILMNDFCDENTSIESVCQKLHISTSYFSVLFKRETHKTFHQYLTDLRMDKAMTMLAQSDARTADVAQAVGIPDPSYFSYAFKKHFGISPSQARKE